MSLRTQVLATVLAIVFSVLVLVEGYRLWSVRGEETAILRERADRIATVQAAAMARPMFDYDHRVVQVLVEAIGADPDVIGVRVEDEIGAVVASFGVVPPDRVVLVETRPIAMEHRGRTEHLGTLTVAYAKDALDRSVNRQVILGTAGLAGLLAALSAAILLTFRRIAKPLGEITTSLLGVSAGRRNLTIPGLDRDDEIGDMARATEAFLRQSIAIERLEADKAAAAAARASEERLRLIVDNMPVPLLMTRRADGTILYANRSLLQEFFPDGGDPVGGHAGDYYVLPEDRRRLIAAVDRDGQVANFETRLRRPDGSVFWALMSIVATTFRGEPVLIAGINDITTQRAAREELQRAREAAEQASRLKGDFLANMSHEIRTPLNAVIGMAHLALRTELTAEQREYLATIRTSSENLLGIINDILDFSKIEAGRVDIERIEFDLDDVLANAARMVAQKAFEKRLELVFDIAADLPRRWVGDPLRLGQVLINLLNNAVKFTERGDVVLRARAGDAGLAVEVRDTGIGMLPEQAARLFQPFVQGDATISRRYGGTGLGLSISRRLIALMGGEIGVDSAPGRGTSFRFTLPLGRAAPADDEPAPELAGKLVLVADANAATRAALADWLAASGARVLTAAGAEAPAEPVDLALVAASLADGIAARLPAPCPTVVLMPAGGGCEPPEAADGGCWLRKPLTPWLLRRTIARLSSPRPAPALAEAAAADIAGRLRGLRILLAEDNEINQRVASRMLTLAGASVTVAGDGRQAVALAQARPDAFDVVLMDVQMPVMNGLDATRLIRADPRLERLPVIAMTAQAMPDERRQCLEAGMVDHVGKPFLPEHLVATVARFAGRAPAHAAPAPDAGFVPLDGLARVGGDRELFRELLELFLAHHRQSGEAVIRALAAGDRGAARAETHSLKGAAGNIGLDEVWRVAARLEAALVEDEGSTDMLAAELNGALAQAVAEIAAYLGHGATA